MVGAKEMMKLGTTHNFKRCKGKHVTKDSGVVCRRYVRWYSSRPRAVHEALFGQKSIWIRKGADRYP